MGDPPMAFVTFDDQFVSDRQRQWAARKGTIGAVAQGLEAYPIAVFYSLLSHVRLSVCLHISESTTIFKRKLTQEFPQN